VNDVIRKVHVPNLIGIEYEGSSVNPPTIIPWYPGGLAWQLNVHKNIVRKVPEFKKLQSFLVYETEVVRYDIELSQRTVMTNLKGNISRQEAVSMLPPLVLDVEPHHKASLSHELHELLLNHVL
jgi:multisite-specific tRNA:(cytosine-C5)-methyltransferase